MAATDKTLNYEFPFPKPSDPVDVAGDLKLLAQKLDVSLDAIVKQVAGTMVSGNTETGITVEYDISLKKFNFVLDVPYIKDQVSPMFVHNLHTGVSATYNDVDNRVILEVTGGGGGGGGGVGSASLTDIWWLGV